jgi:hypothetical protein
MRGSVGAAAGKRNAFAIIAQPGKTRSLPAAAEPLSPGEDVSQPVERETVLLAGSKRRLSLKELSRLSSKMSKPFTRPIAFRLNPFR